MPASELIERLGEDEIVVVDCRDGAAAWPLLSVKIPGALRISVTELADVATSLPDDELIVLYGSDEDGLDVRRAWRILYKANRHAVCLSGGIAGWISMGFPTERDNFDPVTRL